MVGSEDWISNMRSALMVVASLNATVAFQAVISPAGGLFQENGKSTRNDMPSGYSIGTSVMSFYAKPSYTVYMATTNVAFLSSAGIILLLISGFPLGRRLFMWVLMIIMWLSIISLSLTYTIASEFMRFYPGHPVQAETTAPPLRILNFYIKDKITSHFESIHFLTFYVFWALLCIILFGNLLRLVVRLVHKVIGSHNQRGPSTSNAQDSNV